MTTFLIHVDTRERKRLPFPATLPVHYGGRSTTIALRTEKKELLTGDYCLYTPSSTTTAVIETKRSFDEICANTVTDDLPRFRRCLDRLRQFKHRLLIAECGFSPTTVTTRTKRPAFAGLDQLIGLGLEYEVPIQFFDGRSDVQRRWIAEYAARFLVAAHYHETGRLQ